MNFAQNNMMSQDMPFSFSLFYMLNDFQEVEL